MMRNEEQLKFNNVKLEKIVGEAIEASFTAEEMAEMGYMPKNPAKAAAVSAVASTSSSLTTEEFYNNSIKRWSQNGKSHSSCPPIKGFIGVAVRHALINSLKTKFSQKEAIRGYYSCLIDVFYATLDWGAAVKKSSDSAVAITRKRLVQLLDELNRWILVLQLAPLTRTSVKYLVQLILNENGLKLKNIIVCGLTELNTSAKPKSIDYLVKASFQTAKQATA